MKTIHTMLIPAICILSIISTPQQSVSLHLTLDSTVCVNGSLMNYFNNIEYFNDYCEGRTLLGGSVKCRLLYKPTHYWQSAIGFFLRKDYGDEVLFSDKRPLFHSCLTTHNISIIIGELKSDSCHGLPDALYAWQSHFTPGIEEGLQFLFHSSFLTGDVWLDWRAQNTDKHTENFRIGTTISLRNSALSIYFMGYYDHHGGQQFKIIGDPIRETALGAIKFSVDQRVALLLPLQLNYSVTLFASHTSNTEIHPKNGFGINGDIFATHAGYLIGFSVFKGSHFFSTTGNPLYKTKNPYYFVYCNYIYTVRPSLSIQAGGRMEWIDVSFSHYDGQHQMWLLVATDF